MSSIMYYNEEYLRKKTHERYVCLVGKETEFSRLVVILGCFVRPVSKCCVHPTIDLASFERQC